MLKVSCARHADVTRRFRDLYLVFCQWLFSVCYLRSAFRGGVFIVTHTRDAFAQKMRRYETSNDARHKGGEISGIPPTWITKHTVKLNCVFYTESQHSSYDSIRRTKSPTKVTSVHPGLHLFISPVFKTGRRVQSVQNFWPSLSLSLSAEDSLPCDWTMNSGMFRAAQRYKICFSNIAAKMSQQH